VRSHLYRDPLGVSMVLLARSPPKRLLWFNGGLIHCKYRPEIENSHDPAQWDAWAVDGPWANTETGYCMRLLFDGILQWNSLLRLRFGT
jgi:hypothetical protein